MTFSCMPAKLEHLAQCAGFISADAFAETLCIETGIQRGVVMHWFKKENVTLRATLSPLIDFLKARGITLERSDFKLPLDQFESKIVRSSQGHTPMNTTHDNPDYLLGRYQIIRPHVSSNKTYILEAMEIECAEGCYNHLFLSHNQPDKAFLYEGKGYDEPRYYFAMLSRQHEDFPARHSHRCVLFHTEEKYGACLSGVMLRGVHGGFDGKEAAAVPFIALKIPGAESLRNTASAPVPSAVAIEKPLSRLHSDGHILLGEVREREYKPIFDLCREIFTDVNFVRATQRDLVLRTVPPGVLKEMDSTNEPAWTRAVNTVFTLQSA